jgi:hypothetical protein
MNQDTYNNVVINNRFNSSNNFLPSFTLYKFTANQLLKYNYGSLIDDNSSICISHSIFSKINELDTKMTIKGTPVLEFTHPYCHLTQDILKYKYSLFHLELMEIIKFNNWNFMLENKYNRVLIVDSMNGMKHVDFLKFYRPTATANNIIQTSLDTWNSLTSSQMETNKFQLIFFNCVYKQHYAQLIQLLQKYHSEGGTTIIKTRHMFYKQSIELMVLLNILYKNISIIQPTISNVAEGYIFILCKNRQRNINTEYNLKVLNDTSNSSSSLYPLSFLNKIEDMNIYFGKRQLEAMQQYLEKSNKYHNSGNSILSTNNMNAHIKANREKCIQWCNYIFPNKPAVAAI